jgi:tetrapyrrole methylase family protein/MazG family protein
MSEPAERDSFARLLDTIRELRQRCPWDREQKLSDAARHLIEEAYEAGDAIASDKSDEIADELGDLIVQALFAASVAAEEGRHGVAAVLDHARRKLVRRHPHVYGDGTADTVEQVLDTWERVKREERKSSRASNPLAETGRALPALMRAEKLGEKARRHGMDWADARGVLAKVREELEEAEQALADGDETALCEEIGDMMLALANIPRFLRRNAEETLRRSCDKFIERFGRVERIAAARGLNLKALSAAEVEALWQEAKRNRGAD